MAPILQKGPNLARQDSYLMLARVSSCIHNTDAKDSYKLKHSLACLKYNGQEDTTPPESSSKTEDYFPFEPHLLRGATVRF